MREIKFRFFDKIKKRVLDVERLIFPIDENNYCIVTTEGYFRINEGQLMQYTGLKDKNGKEIYEGDIIRATFPDCTAVVAWEQDTVRNIGYTIESERKIVYVDRVDRNDKSAVEVIGNIYENKELLEVE